MTVTINYNTQAISAHTLGRIGEHNATTLVITPPTELSEDSRTTHYRIAFGVRDEAILSEAFTETPITVSLSKQLTRASRLSIQVVAYDSEGNYVGKSDKLSGFCLAPSVEGTEISADGTNSDIAWEIVALSEDVDALDDRVTVAESEIADKADKAKEIADGGGGSRFTPAEIMEMDTDSLLYNGKPVLSKVLIGEEVRILYAEIRQGRSQLWGVSTISADKRITSTQYPTLTSDERTKLAGIESGANKYILPPATDSTLGGIKVGENLTIEEDGTLNASGGELTTDELVSVCVTDFISVGNNGLLGADSSTLLTF